MVENKSPYKLEQRHIPFDQPEYLDEKQYSRDEQDNELLGQNILEVYDSLKYDIKKFLELANEATNDQRVQRRYVSRTGEEIPAAEYYLSQANKKREEINQLDSRGVFNKLKEEFSILLKALKDKPENSDKKNAENKQRREDTLREISTLLKPLTDNDILISLADIEKIFADIKNNNYSNEDLLKVLRIHREYISSKEELLDRKVEIYKDKFIDRVRSMVKESKLPESALVHLDSIRIAKPNLIDYLNELISRIMGKAKECEGLLVKSIMLEDRYESKLRSAVYHEFVHILSGKGVNLYFSINQNDELLRALTGSSRYSKKIKNGLMFYSYKYDSTKIRNRSLNEATTELLSLLILGDNDWNDNENGKFQGSEFYVEERKKMDKLIKKGLNKKTLFEAYFENITSEQSVSERFKYTGKLIREMDAIDKGVYLRWSNEDKMTVIADLLVQSNIFTIGNIPNDIKDLDKKVFFVITFSIGETQHSMVKQSFVYIPKGEKIDLEEVTTVEKAFDKVRKYFGGKVVGVRDVDNLEKINKIM